MMTYKEIARKTGQALREKSKVKEEEVTANLIRPPVDYALYGSYIGEAEAKHSMAGGYNQVNYLQSARQEDTRAQTFSNNVNVMNPSLNTDEEVKNENETTTVPRRKSFDFDELVTHNPSSLEANNTLTGTTMEGLLASMMSMDLDTTKKNDTMQYSQAFVHKFGSSGPFDSSSDTVRSNFTQSAPPYSAVYLKDKPKFYSKEDFNPSRSKPAYKPECNYSLDMKGDDSSHHMSFSLDQSEDNLRPVEHFNYQEDGDPSSRRQNFPGPSLISSDSNLSNASARRQTIPAPTPNRNESDLHESNNETQTLNGSMPLNDKFDQSMAFDESIAKIDFGLNSVLCDSIWKVTPTSNGDNSTDFDVSTDI